MNKLITSTLLLALSGCAQLPDSREVDTVRICDDNGCSDRSKSGGTFTVEAESPETVARLNQLIELANEKPEAAWDLGLRYFRGDGVRQDSYQALTWMRDAGSRGIVEAQLAVGRFYLMGLEEMGSDPAEAESWLLMASSNGSKEAEALLKEAQEAKKDAQELYRWRTEYRPRWYSYWYTTYTYYWSWRPTGWYYVVR